VNPKLDRIHSILAFAYFFFAGVGALVIIRNFFREEHEEIWFGLACLVVSGSIGLIHFYASKGARMGAPWGRTMSRVIGVLLLFGFPIGTAIGAFILTQCGSKWQANDSSEALPCRSFDG
jgi:hypothetical protein